ncbi:MAG: sugar isomerase [Nitrobacter sp. 62-13]|uniref:D-sedoheptulose 7-phosphate isomerase n=1 Tax=Nitrobacter sp. 62-13 TaxID=1895797 RepID=UPI0009697F40|nr:D-sedoheptulose 7-phosphate isomerase [Nitrobacter sp. 62-13]OJU24312.1 MAG: sugar isomerase [Nitrobacter sp. 62-13]
MSQNQIATHFQQSLAALERAAGDAALLAVAGDIAIAIVGALRSGHKVLLIGNGGSAADAQHIASEIVGRYRKERPGFAAIALTTDTSALTAISNDYGFEQIFARQVESLGRQGDVLLALSTSGRSPNILAALAAARRRGLVTVGFTGLKGSSLREFCDHLFIAPSDDTPVIQQIHMTASHAICDSVEHAMADGCT